MVPACPKHVYSSKQANLKGIFRAAAHRPPSTGTVEKDYQELYFCRKGFWRPISEEKKPFI